MLLDDAHALVIAISRYQRVRSLPDTQDAEDIVGVLRDPTCCAYPVDAVHTLRDDQATRAAVLDALDALARDTGPGSTVWIHFSGHGVHVPLTTGDRYFLVPVDAEISSVDALARTGISGDELAARLQAIPAGRLTLVLDCCSAAELARAQLAAVVEPLSHGRGRVVIAAARDAAPLLAGHRDSPLTGHLVDGLRGAAQGIGGVIRICDLFHYVQQAFTGTVARDAHPVFKAELEENYPIARFLGGAPQPLAVPPPPDDFAYDAFVSYCQDDADDRAWVTDVVVPFLEGLGLTLCLEDRDFRLGASRIAETDRAVIQSRYTVAVFSPAYLAGAFDLHDAVLATHVAIEARRPCLIPLVRRPCTLALHARMTEVLDASDEAHVPAALQRLAVALREPPRERLDA
jgi:hypothetical protein